MTVFILWVCTLLGLLTACRTIPNDVREKTVRPQKTAPVQKWVRIKKVSTLGRRLFESFQMKKRDKCMELFPPFEELSRTLVEEDIVEYSMKDYPRLRDAYIDAYEKIIKKHDFATAKFISLSKGEKQVIDISGADKNKLFLFHDNLFKFESDDKISVLKIPVILMIDGNYYIPILYQ